jgi:hypothetical protein
VDLEQWLERAAGLTPKWKYDLPTRENPWLKEKFQDKGSLVHPVSDPWVWNVDDCPADNRTDKPKAPKTLIEFSAGVLSPAGSHSIAFSGRSPHVEPLALRGQRVK